MIYLVLYNYCIYVFINFLHFVIFPVKAGNYLETAMDLLWQQIHIQKNTYVYLYICI